MLRWLLATILTSLIVFAAVWIGGAAVMALQGQPDAAASGARLAATAALYAAVGAAIGGPLLYLSGGLRAWWRERGGGPPEAG